MNFLNFTFYALHFNLTKIAPKAIFVPIRDV